MVGQTITADSKEYEIIKLLAKGKGGYNYLAKTGDTVVVIKQIHYEPCDYFKFEDNKLNSELRDYKTLCDLGIPMPKLLSFNQEEQFLIKEYMPDGTLAQIIANNKLKDNHIWFLANQKGLVSFVRDGDYSSLLENGKPIQKGFEGKIERWLQLKEYEGCD